MTVEKHYALKILCPQGSTLTDTYNEDCTDDSYHGMLCFDSAGSSMNKTTSGEGELMGLRTVERKGTGMTSVRHPTDKINP